MDDSRETQANKQGSTKRPSRPLFIAAVGIQFVVLSFLAIPQAFTLTTADTIHVAAQVADPPDIFRGDYLAIESDLTVVPADRDRFAPGTPVYVRIARDSLRRWRPIEVSDKRLEPGDGERLIRGKTRLSYRSLAEVNYGLERVYVPEGSETVVNRKDQLDLEIAISPRGDTVLKTVRAGKKVIYKWRVF